MAREQIRRRINQFGQEEILVGSNWIVSGSSTDSRNDLQVPKTPRVEDERHHQYLEAVKNHLAGHGDDIKYLENRIVVVEGLAEEHEDILTPVFETTLQAAASVVTIQGLDSKAHGGYRIEFEILGSTTSAQLAMYINNNTTSTNYYSQYLYATGASMVAARTNTANVANTSTGTAFTTGIIDIHAPINDGTGWIHRWGSRTNRGGSAAIESVTYEVAPNFYADNITRIDFSISAGTMLAGSNFRVFRKK